jgi:hypothetical protein
MLTIACLADPVYCRLASHILFRLGAETSVTGHENSVLLAGAAFSRQDWEDKSIQFAEMI